MLRRFLNAYRLAAADARDAVVDKIHQVFAADADEDAAFFAVATKTLCAAAIFCEIAMADDELAAGEKERVRDLLLVRFGLNDAEADALFKIGRQATADSSRLPRMTASVRDHFNREERIELIEMLFDLAHANGEQHAREIEIAEQAGTAIGLNSQEIQRARAKIAERHRALQPEAPAVAGH
jgi:uncharacterized tellurite resistance protein B-like protein